MPFDRQEKRLPWFYWTVFLQTFFERFQNMAAFGTNFLMKSKRLV